MQTTTATLAPAPVQVAPKIPVSLRPWYGGDLPLLGRLMGDPMMTTYIGGPESAKELRERHTRYSEIVPYKGAMFVILAGDGEDQKAAGSIGYWVIEWQGQYVWETGWSVLPEFQGMGVASQAAALVIKEARANGRHRTLHAFPSVENAASNGVCRKVGFTLQGEVDFEYYRVSGRSMRCNDWCLPLFGN
jgi:RimJ/RimL family protein N-acetyltransferase